MQTNVMAYLDETVKRLPDKIAFANESEGYTFKNVYDQSRSIGTFFHNQNYYRKPVIVFMDKHPKTIMAFFGVITAGCYYVPIDEEMPQSRVDLILEKCKPEWIICDAHTIEKAKEFS